MKLKINTERILVTRITKEDVVLKYPEIELLLQNINFDDISFKNQVITFSGRFWRAGSNTAYSTAVSNGSIEFDDSNHIRVSAYTSYRGSILIALLLIILSIVVHWFLAFGIVLLAIQFAYSIDKIKSVNEDIIDKAIEIFGTKDASR
jgi:hypothetical protein